MSGGAPYSWLMLAGIVVGIFYWRRNFARKPGMLWIYFGGLGGAFFGAKVVYLLAEGWLYWGDPNRWLILATGKTIIGALLGGYGGVELAKIMIGHREPTGDAFAAIMPFSIMLGRVGCLLQGCCLGVACRPAWYALRGSDSMCHWPAAVVELLFNAIAFVTFHFWRRRHFLPGQHFHVYLMAYGLFRFAHEFLRETPKVFHGLSGYQIASLAAALLGLIRFRQRRRKQRQSKTASAPL